MLSRATRRLATAREWLAGGGDGDLDGVVAKRLDLPYRSGERDGMLKVKRQRTADCVVGGFRYASKGRAVGSLLLGLYDDEGLLDHVGFCSSLSAAERKGLTARLERLRKPPGFTGRAPGGPSRWSTERSAAVGAARPEAGRGGGVRSRLQRAASATAPGSCAGGRTRRRAQCTMEQLDMTERTERRPEEDGRNPAAQAGRVSAEARLHPHRRAPGRAAQGGAQAGRT